MEIVIYIGIYLVGMFISSAIVQFVDPYGMYVEEPICTVLWPIAFPIWFICRIAKVVNELVYCMLP